MLLAGYPIVSIAFSEFLHFVSSALAGLLGWWLISTILRHGTEVVIFRHYSLRSVLSYCFAVFMAIWVHVMVDFTTEWF